MAVHGLPGTVRDFRWLAPALSDEVRLVRLDMPGFGATDAAWGFPAAGRAADHVARVLDHLGVDRAVLMSHSFGSTHAVAAAVRHPDRIAGLALLAPIGFRPHRGLRRLPAPRWLERGLQTPLLEDGLIRVLERAYYAAGFRGVTHGEIERTIISLNELSWPRYRARIALVTQPTLCAWTLDDRIVEPELSREVARSLPDGPRLAFPTGGHNLQKSRAVEIADALVPWASKRLGA